MDKKLPRRLQNDFDGNAAREIAPKKKISRREQELNRIKLEKLTQEQLRKARRENIQVKNIIKTAATVAVVGALVVTFISGQVTINELTAEINDSKTDLAQLQSIEVQLNMQAMNSLNDSQLRTFAQQSLGMNEILDEQIIYVNMSTQDKGTVYIEESKNLWDQIIGFFGF